MLAAMLTIVKTASSVARDEAEQPLGHDVGQPPVGQPGELGDRQRVQVEHVQREIDDDHRQRAERERERQVAARIANLLGDVRRGVPPRVG